MAVEQADRQSLPRLRAKALASVYLTRRDGATVAEVDADPGIELLATNPAGGTAGGCGSSGSRCGT